MTAMNIEHCALIAARIRSKSARDEERGKEEVREREREEQNE